MNTLGGEYAMKARTELLMESRGERHPTEIAYLFGRRFVAASETPDGGRLNESLIKDLTGRERLRGRRMREDFWEFAPTHKIVLLTNYKPRVAGNDEGIWRRLRLIPFEVTFWDPDKYPDPAAAGLSPELKQDKELDGKLQAEAEGILAWLVRGCLDWLRGGLTLPDAVRAATASYRAAEDTLGQFIAERCDTGDRSARCKRSELYGAYKAWSDARGEKALGSKRFSQGLLDRDFQSTTSNGTWYQGLALRRDEDEEVFDPADSPFHATAR
jgi:putative DNA primase/helicase